MLREAYPEQSFRPGKIIIFSVELLCHGSVLLTFFGSGVYKLLKTKKKKRKFETCNKFFIIRYKKIYSASLFDFVIDRSKFFQRDER